ncbi:MAG: hypothetical protein ABW153_01265, partial [Sedimenticola sp.]
MGIQDWVSRESTPQEPPVEEVMLATPVAEAPAPSGTTGQVQETARQPDAPEMPPWMEDVPPLTDDFAPVE